MVDGRVKIFGCEPLAWDDWSKAMQSVTVPQSVVLSSVARSGYVSYHLVILIASSHHDDHSINDQAQG